MSRFLHAAAAMSALAFALMACLEGDPNPVTGQTPASSGVGGTSSSSSGSTSSGSTGSTGQPGTVPTVTPGNTCSQQSSQLGITLTFQNNFSDRVLSLFWVDFNCKEVLYSNIGPNRTYQQATFINHTWRMRDVTTGALYKEFTPTGTNVSVVAAP